MPPPQTGSYVRFAGLVFTFANLRAGPVSRKQRGKKDQDSPLMMQAFKNSPPRRYRPVSEDGPVGEFWRSGADGVLRIARCQACGFWIHPYKAACPCCHSRNLAPAAISGKATLETWTINYQKWFRGLDDPFVVGLVTMVEQAGLNITTNIVNCEFADLRIGMPVRVVFENIEDTWLALFEPDPDAA